ncbi:hypothetical protein ZIOFF_036155 [Zingiber officinale]|uniref:Uncharacterized protein n=1 Tax=Zingiber officinale TaxID=94328 RepID=A0A8J5L8F2_ZINOF|nr:hypothetical protein ZIOFF_036155 [Zingiber officinale]
MIWRQLDSAAVRQFQRVFICSSQIRDEGCRFLCVVFSWKGRLRFSQLRLDFVYPLGLKTAHHKEARDRDENIVFTNRFTPSITFDYLDIHLELQHQGRRGLEYHIDQRGIPHRDLSVEAFQGCPRLPEEAVAEGLSLVHSDLANVVAHPPLTVREATTVQGAKVAERWCEELYMMSEGETVHTIGDKCSDPFIVECNSHADRSNEVGKQKARGRGVDHLREEVASDGAEKDDGVQTEEKPLVLVAAGGGFGEELSAGEDGVVDELGPGQRRR